MQGHSPSVAGEGSQVLSEFAGLEAQLSRVELYAMKFLEAETADFTAEQLRIAEVSGIKCV